MIIEKFKTTLYIILFCILAFMASLYGQNSIMRAIFGSLLFLYLPGFLMLYTFRVKDLSLTKAICFSVVLSIVFTVAVGLLSNLLVVLHISDNAFIIKNLLVIYVFLLFAIMTANYKGLATEIHINYTGNGWSIFIFLALIIFTTICSLYRLYSSLFYLPVIISVIVILYLVRKKVNYTLIIFTIALALLLQSNLLTSNLMGSDIVLEYWVHAKVLQNGYWDLSIPNIYHSALGLVFVTPIYETVLDISGIYIFKIIIPIIYAITPVILYLLYSKFFSAKIAFLSAILYTLIPVYFLEMPYVVRQQIALPVFVTLLYLIMSNNEFSITLRGKVFAFILLCATPVLYYGIDIIFAIYLSIILVAIFANKVIKLKFSKYRVNWFTLKYVALAFIIIATMSFVYYYFTSGGVTITSAILMVKAQIGQFINGSNEQYIYPWSTSLGDWTSSSGNVSGDKTDIISIILNFGNRIPLISAGLGLDFFSVSLAGKIYRILTALINFSIVGGSIYIILNRKRYSTAYVLAIMASIVAIVVYLVLPVLPYYLGATRFYHILIIIVAPAIVLFGRFILLKFFGVKQYLLVMTTLVIIPYFIFSSGMVFELLKFPTMDQLDIPFSPAISGGRLNMGIDLVAKDVEAMKVIEKIVYKNNNSVVFMDLYSKMLTSQEIIWVNVFDWDYKTKLIDEDGLDEGYLFLNTKNIITGQFVLPSGYGLRKTVDIAEDMLVNRKLLYDDYYKIYSPKLKAVDAE